MNLAFAGQEQCTTSLSLFSLIPCYTLHALLATELAKYRTGAAKQTRRCMLSRRRLGARMNLRRNYSKRLGIRITKQLQL